MDSAAMCPRCSGFGTVMVKGRYRQCHHGYVRAAFTGAEGIPITTPSACAVPSMSGHCHAAYLDHVWHMWRDGHAHLVVKRLEVLGFQCAHGSRPDTAPLAAGNNSRCDRGAGCDGITGR